MVSNKYFVFFLFCNWFAIFNHKSVKIRRGNNKKVLFSLCTIWYFLCLHFFSNYNLIKSIKRKVLKYLQNKKYQNFSNYYNLSYETLKTVGSASGLQRMAREEVLLYLMDIMCVKTDFKFNPYFLSKTLIMTWKNS